MRQSGDRVAHSDVRRSGEPDAAGLVMDVPDLDAVMAAMETDAAADAMAYDGVLPETLVILIEA